MPDNPRIEDLRRRVQKDPASIAFAQLAEEYRRAGQHQDAIDTCRAGLDRHPGYLSARVTLGRALVEIGQLDEAQHEFELVLKGASENLAAIRGLAEIHHSRGSLNDALTYYKAALALARNDPDLEEKVTDLTRQIVPQKRKDPEDGLSLAQMQEELSRGAASLPDLRRPTVTPPAASPPLIKAPVSEQSVGSTVLESVRPSPTVPVTSWSAASASADPQTAAENDRAEETVTVLEHWLTAIHVARTQSGA